MSCFRGTLVLSVRNLRVAYGPVTAVHGISLEVAEGELVTIIGANGAGKTSTLNAIMGLVPCAAGEVALKGAALNRQQVERRARQGLSMSPEGRRVFRGLTVLENLTAGGAILDKRTLASRTETMLDQFPVLRERRHQDAGTLSGGEQQMLAIARALMIEPRFLVLDEPSLGLAPKIVAQVFELIAGLKKSGVTVLLVEQNVHKSLAIADRAYVMELGAITREGRAAELAADPQIHASYFGH